MQVLAVSAGLWSLEATSLEVKAGVLFTSVFPASETMSSVSNFCAESNHTIF